MTMSNRELVEAFYAKIWNARDLEVAHRIIDPNFRFRGSLGPEKRGIEGFLDYVDAVHTALGNYTCTIDDLITVDDRAVAQMSFEGIHQAAFFGIPATGRNVKWAGAAFFTISHGKLSKLWVLGDVDAVKQQLRAGSATGF